MFSKVLVANRGEIAIRAFRAAYEIGARTVAVFPHEDRWSEHRLKADEAYEIGELGHPVRAYLDPQAIVAVALRAGADAVYPGYGFLSENPGLARAGSLDRRRDALAVRGVIGWNLRSSWFQRRAGLTTLVATTAGGRQSVTVLDVPEDAALALAHAALPHLVDQFLVSRETRATAHPRPDS